MRTLQHIKVGSKRYAPTGEELTRVLNEFMATGITPWPLEIIRLDEGDGIGVSGTDDLTDDEKHDLGIMAREGIKGPAGSVIVTRAHIQIMRISRDQMQEKSNDASTQ